MRSGLATGSALNPGRDIGEHVERMDPEQPQLSPWAVALERLRQFVED